MDSRFCVGRLWIAGLAALVVGAAVLLAWLATRDALPAGAILVPRDAPTLAAALELAEDGAVIALDARRGPFAAGVTISTPGVTVRSHRGSAVVAGGAGALLTAEADRVTIEGLTLEGAGTGIAIVGADCRIRDMSFRSFAVALEVMGAECAVERTLASDGKAGIYVSSVGTRVEAFTGRRLTGTAIRLREATACLLADVVLDSCSEGILIDASSAVRVVGARVRGCGTSIEVSGGSGVTVERCALADSSVGVMLRDTDSARLAECRVSDMTDVGVGLETARRTVIVQTSFLRCRVGVRTAGSGENAVCDNEFLACPEAVRISGGKGDLVARNSVRGGDTGIALERSSDAQLLRNVVDDASLAGVLLDRVDRVQVLDAQTTHCGVGVSVAASSNVAVRRGAVHGGEIGVAFLNGTLGNVAAENYIDDAIEGMLLAGSSRDAVTGNVIARCDRGVVLRRLGYGVRFEANEVGDCGVGLVWTDSTPAEDTPLGSLGFSVERATSAAAPLVVDNDFRACRVADVQNETNTALLVGGNRWSTAQPRVQGDVHVPNAASSSVGLGTATSTADLVLGRLLQWMLLERDVRVVDLIGLGSEGALVSALGAGDLDAAWISEEAARAASDVFWPMPLARGWCLVTTVEVARAVGTHLAVTVAVPDGVDRQAVVDALTQGGLVARRLERAATSAAAESLLKFGSVDCAVLDRWEETVTLAGFVALDGVRLGAQTIGLCVGRLDSVASAALRVVFDRLAARLSEETLRNLVSRVRLLQRDPADVAMEFLLREGWIEGPREGGTT